MSLNRIDPGRWAVTRSPEDGEEEQNDRQVGSRPGRHPSHRHKHKRPASSGPAYMSHENLGYDHKWQVAEGSHGRGYDDRDHQHEFNQLRPGEVRRDGRAMESNEIPVTEEVRGGTPVFTLKGVTTSSSSVDRGEEGEKRGKVGRASHVQFNEPDEEVRRRRKESRTRSRDEEIDTAETREDQRWREKSEDRKVRGREDGRRRNREGRRPSRDGGDNFEGDRAREGDGRGGERLTEMAKETQPLASSLDSATAHQLHERQQRQLLKKESLYDTSPRLASVMENKEIRIEDFKIPDGNGGKRPTDAYGVLKFTNNDNHAKYIRVHAETKGENLVALLCNYWKLHRPRLVLSVAGGNKKFSMQPQHRDILYRGLTNAAATTEGWLLSAGTYAGIMEDIGKAVQQYNIGSGSRKKLIAIGLPSWECVKGREDLQQMGDTVDYDSTSDVEKGEVCLDCNHTHFLLADDGTNDYNAYIPMQSDLEQAIKDLKIPVVAILLEGGVGALMTVHNSMEKGFPLVIVKNSGRIADCLVDTYTYYKEHPTTSEAKMKEWINDWIRSKKLKLNRDDGKSVERIFDIAVKWHHLVVLYSTLSPNGLAQEFDQSIFRALMHAQDSPLIQLQLALAWNNQHRARQIYIDKIESHDLEQVFLKALVENKTGFVRLLLQNGVDLKKSVTPKTLQWLYEETKANIYLRSAEKKDLSDIGQAIAKIMRVGYVGEGYTAPYQQQQQQQQQQLVGTKRAAWRDLFLWSILQNRREMAMYFLEAGREDMMAGCLIASKLLRALALRTTTEKEQAKEEAKRMQTNAKDFAEMAVRLQNEGYLNNAERGKKDLLRRLEGFGDTNALELAVSTNHKLFLSQTCTQTMLTSRWMGELVDETPKWRLVLAWLFFLFIPCLLHFKQDADPTVSPDGSDTTIQSSEIPGSTRKLSTTADYLPGFEGLQGNRALSYFRRIYCFYQCPAIIFASNTVAFVLFLLLFSYVLLCDLHLSPSLSPYEILLCFWVLTFMLEESRQAYIQGLKIYRNSYWNLLDAVSIAVFALGFILRCVPQESCLVAARHVFAVNLVMFSIRLLHFFSAFRSLGPKLVMIANMMQDLFVFITILFVFIGAFGTAQHAILFPNSPLEGQLVWHLLRRAYWQMFGELFLEEIHQDVEGGECTDVTDLWRNHTMPRCPSDEGKWTDPVFLGIYLMFTQVLMLNLLIAIFSDTYSKIQAETDEHWNFQRYQLIREYCSRPALVPPFIIFSHVFYVVRAVCTRCCDRCLCGKEACGGVCTRRSQRTIARAFKLTLQSKEQEDFEAWSAVRGQDFVLANQQKAKKETDGRVKAMQNQIQDVTRRLENIEKRLESGDAAQQKLMTMFESNQATQQEILQLLQDRRY